MDFSGRSWSAPFLQADTQGRVLHTVPGALDPGRPNTQCTGPALTAQSLCNRKVSVMATSQDCYEDLKEKKGKLSA